MENIDFEKSLMSVFDQLSNYYRESGISVFTTANDLQTAADLFLTGKDEQFRNDLTHLNMRVTMDHELSNEEDAIAFDNAVGIHAFYRIAVKSLQEEDSMEKVFHGLEREISPTRSAYVYTGNNRKNIKKSAGSYSFLID